MGREENVTVFMDTEKQVKSNSKLKNAVDNSSANQKLILETDEISVPDKDRYKNTAEVIVSKKRTLEAASGYNGLNICVDVPHCILILIRLICGQDFTHHIEWSTIRYITMTAYIHLML